MFSYHYNFTKSRVSPSAFQTGSSLIISSGFETTHIIPVIDGYANFDATYRLDIGGSNMMNYLMSMSHLKYPRLYG